MALLRAVLYLLAVVLLVLAAFGVNPPRLSLVTLGWACFVAAFALPAIAAAT